MTKLKLIKEAQLASNLGELMTEARRVHAILNASGTADRIDGEIVAAVKALHKRQLTEGTLGELGATAGQIVDQIVSYLAPQAGIDPRYITPQQFTKLAAQFRIELEDHYDEMYSNSEWKQLSAEAYKQYNAQHGAGEENEEHGWPSDDGRPSPENYDDITSDEGSESQAYLGSLGADERDRLRADINEPWGDPRFDAEYEDIPQRPQMSRDGEFDDEFDDEFDIDDGPRFENEEHADDKSDDLTQEQRGWYDGQKANAHPRFPSDSEYMDGFNRARALVKPHSKRGVENEESSSGKGSMLKTLLSQRKEVAKKAGEAMKRFEDEGAKAFHEFRMKHERSPYDKTSNAEEHAAWVKGWQKAATSHYTPVIDPKKKMKPGKKK